jgi:hypothetical protein
MINNTLVGTITKSKSVTADLEKQTTTETTSNTDNKNSSIVNADNSTASSENKEIDWETKLANSEKEYASLDKRFRDNQSFTQKKTNELEAENKELKTALLDKQKSELPSSKEDLEALAQENPKLVDAMRRLVGEQSLADKNEIETKIKDLQKTQKKLKLEKQYTDLLAIHPDAEEIKESDGFRTWLNSQDEDIQSIPYNEKASVKMLSMLFTQYKDDLKVQESNTDNMEAEKQKMIENSQSVASSRDIPIDSTSELMKASDIHKMSSADWAKHRERIWEAAGKGLILADA